MSCYSYAQGVPKKTFPLLVLRLKIDLVLGKDKAVVKNEFCILTLNIQLEFSGVFFCLAQLG